MLNDDGTVFLASSVPAGDSSSAPVAEVAADYGPALGMLFHFSFCVALFR